MLQKYNRHVFVKHGRWLPVPAQLLTEKLICLMSRSDRVEAQRGEGGFINREPNLAEEEKNARGRGEGAPADTEEEALITQLL